MDLSSQIQLVRIPRPVGILIVALSALAVMAAVFMFYRSVVDGDKPDWVEASAYLAATILPLFLLTLVIARANTGHDAILKRTSDFLNLVVPDVLSRFPEAESSFATSRVSRRREGDDVAIVATSHYAGDCYADYRIEFVHQGIRRLMQIRIELNVRKFNFNLCLNDELTTFARRNDKAGKAGFAALKKSAFPHTLNAAEVSDIDLGDDSKGEGGYTFHHELLNREIGDTCYLVLVGTRQLSRDTLWNPAEKLFIAQDLLFMLRAFFNERPDLFRKT